MILGPPRPDLPEGPWAARAGRGLLVLAALLLVAAVAFLVFGLVATSAFAGGIDPENRHAPLWLALPLAFAALGSVLAGRWMFRRERFGRGARGLWAQAEAGDPRAWTRLGRAYLDGTDGLARDEAAARYWLERAVAAGDPEARAELATLLREGRGGPRDRARAEALAAEPGP